MFTRKARLQDAQNVYDLVHSLSGDGTLRATSLRFAKTSAISASLNQAMASFWAAARCTFTGRTWRRCGPSLSRLKRRAAAPVLNWCMHCWRKLNRTAFPASACLPVFQNSSPVMDSRWLSATEFLTRSTKTASNAHDCTPAMRSRWLAASCQASPFSAPQLSTRNWCSWTSET